NKQLAPLGTNIHKARKELTGKLTEVFQSFYKKISLERESVSFSYYSQLNEMTMAELLHKNMERDIMLQRTEAGIHKDDLEFFIAPVSGRSPVIGGESQSEGLNDSAGQED